MFSGVSPGASETERHPLRAIRAMMDQTLAALCAGLEAFYCAPVARPPQE